MQGLVVAAAGLALVVVATGATLTASAAAPDIYGWWAQTSVGALSQTTQPGVPADGMLVQNAPTGAVAISALRFTVASGTVVGKVTLTVSGTALITQPPVAYPTTSPFVGAAGGAWAARPSYDRTHPVTGTVDSSQTQVQFAVGSLVKGDELAIVILAGGPLDRVAFNKPGPDTLTETGTTSGPGDTSQPTGAPATTPAPVPAAGSGLPSVSLPVPSPSLPPASTPAPPPAPVAVLPPPAKPPGLGADVGTSGEQPLKRDVVTLALLPVAVIAVLYWTDGFGSFSLRRAVSRHRVIRMP